MKVILLLRKYKTLFYKSIAALIPAISFYILTTGDHDIFKIVLDQIIYHSLYLVLLKFGSTQLYLETSKIKGKAISIPAETLIALKVIGLIILISDVICLLFFDITRFGFLIFCLQIIAEYIRLKGFIHSYFFFQAPLLHFVSWLLAFFFGDQKTNSFNFSSIIISLFIGLYTFRHFKTNHNYYKNSASVNVYKKLIEGSVHTGISTIINWAPLAFVNFHFDFLNSSRIAFINRSANFVNFYLLGEQSKFPKIIKNSTKFDPIKFQSNLISKALPSVGFIAFVIGVFIFFNFDDKKLLSSLTVILIGVSFTPYFGLALISNLTNNYVVYIKQMTFYVLVLAFLSIIFILFNLTSYEYGCLYIIINASIFLFFRKKGYQKLI